jgi:hypothetical protein
MSCLITKGYSASTGCDDLFSVGGLEEVFLANRSQVVSVTDSNADNVFDEVTFASGAGFYKFDFTKDTASFESALVVGSNKYFRSTLTLSYAGTSPVDLAQFQSLCGSKLVAIVKDKNGRAYLLGRVSSLEAIDGTVFAVGATADDLAGATLVLESVGKKPVEGFAINGTFPVIS